MEDCTSGREGALVQSSDDSEASFHTATEDSTARDSGEFTVTASEGNESTANESTTQTSTDSSPPCGAVLSANATNGTEDSAIANESSAQAGTDSSPPCDDVLTTSVTNGTEDSALCGGDDFREHTIESTTICENSPPPSSNVTAMCVSDVSISTEDEDLTENAIQCETRPTISCGTSPAHIDSANNPTVMRIAEENGLKQELTSDVAPSNEEHVPAAIVCEEERENQVESHPQQINFSVTNKNDDVIEEAMEVDIKMEEQNPTSLSKNDQFSPHHCTNTTENSNTVKDLSDPLNQDQQRETLSSARTAAVDGYQEESDVASLSSSVSHLEGGGRQETASVSSSGYGGSREASPDVGPIITDDMKEEEERLRERESPESIEGEVSLCVCIHACIYVHV